MRVFFNISKTPQVNVMYIFTEKMDLIIIKHTTLQTKRNNLISIYEGKIKTFTVSRSQ